MEFIIRKKRRRFGETSSFTKNYSCVCKNQTMNDECYPDLNRTERACDPLLPPVNTLYLPLYPVENDRDWIHIYNGQGEIFVRKK